MAEKRIQDKAGTDAYDVIKASPRVQATGPVLRVPVPVPCECGFDRKPTNKGANQGPSFLSAGSKHRPWSWVAQHATQSQVPTPQPGPQAASLAIEQRIQADVKCP